jgi:hypothetical protein
LLAGAAAAAAVAAVAAYALVQPEPDRPTEQPPPPGPVLEPIAYQIADDPPPAGDYLRDLAARITDAPYDTHSGAFTYHRTRNWAPMNVAFLQDSSDRGVTELAATFATERETWAAADGSGRSRGRTVGVEFPNEESRREWYANPQLQEAMSPDDPTHVYPHSAGELHRGLPLPTDRDGLIGMLSDLEGVDDLFFYVERLYDEYAVPTEARATVLEILADVPDLKWRGEVTDRAGRTGVAVTEDDSSGSQLLIFDPHTGELLAREVLCLEPDDGPTADPVGNPLPTTPTVCFYGLFLETGWTDDPGPEPTVPDAGSEPTEPGVSPSPDPSSAP